MKLTLHFINNAEINAHKNKRDLQFALISYNKLNNCCYDCCDGQSHMVGKR